MNKEVLDEKKVNEGFIQFKNDLFFHHLVLNNERIRNMICQQLIPDRKIISTTVKNEKQYGSNYREKKLILDLLAKDDQGIFYNVEMQTYDMTIDIVIRTQLYGAEMIRRQTNMGDDYDNVKDVRQMIINAANPLEGCHYYRHDFTMYDKEHGVELPNSKIFITIIQLKYIEQVMEKMDAFNQLMYLFQNDKVYDKIKADRLVKEAVEMHEKYISSEENYIEYWNRLDNLLLMNSKIKQAKKAEEKAQEFEEKAQKFEEKAQKFEEQAQHFEVKAQEYEKQAQEYEKQAQKHEARAEKYENKFHEEKIIHLKRTINSINQYIQMKFTENMSEWLNQLNEEQVYKIQDRLYEFNSLEELKKVI